MASSARPPTGAARVAVLMLLASILGAGPAFAAPASAAPLILTVRSPGDGSDLSPGNGRCEAAGGGCTLRAAIEESNTHHGQEIIAFHLGSRRTISPHSRLPDVTGPVLIDGTTQPGYAGRPLVTVSGRDAGGDADALSVTPVSDGAVVVTGLHFTRFGYGIVLRGDAGGTQVKRNVLGARSAGARGNECYGILVETSGNEIIGNTISGNGCAGISLSGPGADRNTILGNRIGTDHSGSVRLGNDGPGIVVLDGAHNRIGGPGKARRNLISANTGPGVQLSGTRARGNHISGNWIGLDGTGRKAFGNELEGVAVIHARGNLIGRGNVISGNGQGAGSSGVGIYFPEATANTVAGNRIGTNAHGTHALPNAGAGVSLTAGAHGNLVGGSGPDDGNLISGNFGDGVGMRDPGTSANTVAGNIIGLDASGKHRVPNGAAGVVLEMGVSRNVVGGRRDGAGNIVSGNRGAGVVVYDFSDQGTRGNKVLGNIVGLGTRGARGLGNGLSGLVVIGAMDTVLGAPGAGNVVAGNHDMGISVNEGTGNRIAANSYGPNGRLAVDLGGDGVTPNDPGDSDGGPNRLQNMPTVLRVTDSAVRGVLNSVADTTFVVEVQRVRSCGGRSPSTILARRSVTTNAHGHARFTIRLPSPLPGGSGVFAGATDPSGDSSELSPCRSV